MSLLLDSARFEEMFHFEARRVIRAARRIAHGIGGAALLLFAAAALATGCAGIEERTAAAASGGDPGSGVGAGAASPVDRASTSQAPETIEDTVGPGKVVGWMTGSWATRTRDRKGLRLVGGALAYDMLDVERVGGQPAAASLTSHGLLGIVGRHEKQALDGSGGHCKSHWVFPFYRYHNFNGERTVYPLFVFPVSLQPEESVLLDPAPWDLSLAGGAGAAEERLSAAPSKERRIQLREPPAAASAAGTSLANISETLRAEREARNSLRATYEKEPLDADGEPVAAAAPSSTRGAPARAPAKAAAAASTATAAKSGASHKVTRGDTLTSIAKKYYGSGKDWKRIYEANRGKLPHPDRIKIGMILAIP